MIDLSLTSWTRHIFTNSARIYGWEWCIGDIRTCLPKRRNNEEWWKCDWENEYKELIHTLILTESRKKRKFLFIFHIRRVSLMMGGPHIHRALSMIWENCIFLKRVSGISNVSYHLFMVNALLYRLVFTLRHCVIPNRCWNRFFLTLMRKKLFPLIRSVWKGIPAGWQKKRKWKPYRSV